MVEVAESRFGDAAGSGTDEEVRLKSNLQLGQDTLNSQLIITKFFSFACGQAVIIQSSPQEYLSGGCTSIIKLH